MRTIVHFMGMKSTKYGGLEKFMTALVRQNNDMRFVLVYEEHPVSNTYVKELQSLNVIIEVINFNSLGLLKQLTNYRAILEKYSPEIVHFHFSNNLGALIARLWGIKRVYKTVHSCITCNGLEVESYKQLGLKQRIFSVGGLVNRLYTEILFVSDYTKNQYAKVFGDMDTYRRVYLGIESPVRSVDNDFSANVSLPEGCNVISTIAFAHPLKGVDVLIKAIPKIPNAIFLIIGLSDCEYTNELVSLAISLGVNERIRWIGITDNVVNFLQISDLYVQPSRTEALSLAACEALALGVPVVGSNVGGLPEVALRVFERENHLHLAEIIDEILMDSTEYNNLVTQSLNSFEQKFKLVDAIETYSKIYSN